MDDLDTLKINQFDLLSAYIDNEVSLSERKQVEDWLQSDSEFRLLYQQLLQVQRSCQAMPVPPPSMPVEQTVEQVMARLDARRRIPVWATLGVGTVFLGGLTGLLTGSLRAPQLANTSIGEIAGAPLEQPISLPSTNPVAPPGLNIDGSLASIGESPSLMIRIDQPLIPPQEPEAIDIAPPAANDAIGE